MTVSTLTSHATAPVNVLFQSNALRQARARAVYFVGHKPGVLTRHANTLSVTWRRIDALTPTTSALTELSGTLTVPTRAATAIGVTDTSATASKYGDHVFLTEEADLVNFSGLVDEIVTALGIQAGRSMNRLQRNILEDNATAIYANGASANSGVTNPITNILIRNAVNALQSNSALKFTPVTEGSRNIGTAPVNAAYWGLCHVDVEEDIRNLSGFRGVETYAGQTETAIGEFGVAAGARWLSSEEATVDASAGGNPGSDVRSTNGDNADIYPTVILGMEAHGAVSLDTDFLKTVYMAGDRIPAIELISKPRGSAGAGDPFNEVSSLAWKGWHTGAILDANWIRCLRVAASTLTEV